ncbi:hypothetical protein B5P46_04105 [Rhizobium leguminosarum]|uniref:Sacsin/Nov domain-containing protein n=1 Tax=Rhizobium leguminosarum TaxID=384 RepID=A0A4Q1U8H1_RHILE|nr:hypothetical protein [Rhizobium leguminosarum]RXT28004.1 hypothetical protein B5P46_04105 [Rhizobium leguminosarum]
MSAFLDALMAQRRKFLDGLDANEGDINLDIFEDFYPDQAHFVFELLQNAEDTGATDVAFFLTEKGCWFEHNGTRAFTEPDVRAITGIHNSTKKKSPDQIGKFGVGFKSVFVYTLTPTIYSADFSFQISRLVMPEPVASDPSIGGKTKFWLPFNNPNKATQAAFSEIKAGLSELAETTLLFLPNIESIKWRVGHDLSGAILRIAHTDSHLEVMKQINGQTTTSSHFLKFDQPVAGLEKQRVAVAFALDFLPNAQMFSSDKPLSQQLKIVSVPGQVAVFFPAGKETSGLRFHLHAPFVPELSRASIKETPANKPLFEQLAVLAASSLHKIRDLGLLSTDFLAVLPNPQDQLAPRYFGIRDSICRAINTEPLMPTYVKGHAPAQTLIQAKSSLKELLSSDDIEFLIDYDEAPPQWAASRALQGTNVERFMNGLAIKDWDIASFVDCIDQKASEGNWRGVNTEFMAWLAGKSMEWHQQFYALLAKDSEAQDELYRLKRCKIVRLSEGAYECGPKCHFLDNHDVKTRGVRCVDPAVYTAGKSKAQQESARKFLEDIGATKVGERQLVEAILKSTYVNSARTLNQREYLSHMRRFIKLLDEDPSCGSLLSTFHLFMGKDNRWHKPAEIYLDDPYLGTGLSEYLGIIGTSNPPSPLADFYQSLPIDTQKFTRFAEKLGCLTKIAVARTSCGKNPRWNYLRSVSGERHTSPIDRDYIINRFHLLAAKKSEKLAKLIWNTMCSLSDAAHSYDSTHHQNPLRAVYRKNERGGAHFADSQLIHQLRADAWIPQRTGEFVRPAQARVELLPDGFTFDPGWPWIKAIEFGKGIQLQNARAQAEAAATLEQQRRQQEAAKALGFPDAETARKLAEIPEDELKRILVKWQRQERTASSTPEFPQRVSPNPYRRAERMAERTQAAAPKTYEVRERSVRTSDRDARQLARPYLLDLYTNAADEMICQACHQTMPFNLPDGSPYFEAAELLPEASAELVENHLALCPTCSAKWRHARSSSDADVIAELRAAQTPEILVTLAGEATAVRFVQVHLDDLRTIISVTVDDTTVPVEVK